jgi:hypothetical protein
VIYPENESMIHYFNVESKAVGVNISYKIEQGTGYFIVVEGQTYRDDAYYLEFESGSTIYTSDSFSEGDVVVEIMVK